ncbi:MAG: histidine kinase [Burkholderiaceae bacterium]|nr:histidine kinase [Burkholderiaceae bacterium]
MPPATAIPDQVKAPRFNPGPSAEIRRFSAGLRVVTALLVLVLFVGNEIHDNPWAPAVLLGYCLWSVWLLWVETSGRARHSALWPYWIDVLWSCLMMNLWSAGAKMMVLTLVHPVVLASIAYGVAQGLLVALLATAGMLLGDAGELMRGLSRNWLQTVGILIVLLMVPAAAMVARPMSLLRRRLALLGEIDAHLDPRRGLEPTCAAVVERLLHDARADVVALVLPCSVGAPAMLASREDGGFRARGEMHALLENLLSHMPACPVTHVKRPWWDVRPRTRLHADLPLAEGLPTALNELAQTLEVRSLHIVPLTRYEHRHGHIVVGYACRHGVTSNASVLDGVAPDLLRVVEHAALVDQLQEEGAGHERARIGRDLHDSAIQPYLGLKYAVESAALRIALDNPARAEVDALAELVNGEVSALRELISGLRSGSPQGDNALVPAVLRHARRFTRLFGIDVKVTYPATLSTTRALAGSLFHMVNEALNNVRTHTAARSVWITLAAEASAISLVVRDDGGSVRGHPADAFCPASLSERSAELGGSLHVSYPDGLNTEIVIQIPSDQAQCMKPRLVPPYIVTTPCRSAQAASGLNRAGPKDPSLAQLDAVGATGHRFEARQP